MSPLKLTPSTINPNRQIAALDGIRGLAVILVLLSHLSILSIGFIPYLDFSGIGKPGVFLFFFLSSFLLTLPLLQADSSSLHSLAYWKRYALRRVLRIYPLYLLVLVLSFATIATAAALNIPQADFLLVVFQLPSQINMDGSTTFSMTAQQMLARVTMQKHTGILWSIPWSSSTTSHYRL